MAALAVDHTLPQPHPPPEAEALGDGVTVVPAVAAVLELGESVRDNAGETPFEDGPPPSLTRSVLFLNEGVPARDSGRSKWDEVDRGGSELF